MLKSGVTPHEWGVDDEYLVDFIVNKVNDDKPSFNLIMTTSYIRRTMSMYMPRVFH